MTLIKFQIFYNGQEKYDNMMITYDEYTKKWSTEVPNYNTGIFGNFWPHKKTRTNQQNLNLKITLHNQEFTFTSSEVAFQAAKCKNIDDINKFTSNTFHSGDSFRLGRKIAIRNNWDYIKNDVMVDILLCKFTQYSELKTALLATTDAYLIEHTPVKGRDKYWADDNDGSGKNILGLSLMFVRKSLGGMDTNDKCAELLPQLYQFIATL